MSEHEPTLPERRQAEMLARWLDGQADIPDDLDHDVVEAVLALRPELAPEPALSAEDILADISVGPLALPDLADLADPPAATSDTATDEAETLPPQPLPAAGAEAEDETEPANRPSRWLAWLGAGLGTVAAAAAVVVLIGGPTLLGGLAPEEGSMARLDEADEGATPLSPPAEEKEEASRQRPMAPREPMGFETSGDLAAADGAASKKKEAPPAARERSNEIPPPRPSGATTSGGSGSSSSSGAGRSTGTRRSAPDDAFADAPTDASADAVADLGELEDSVAEDELDLDLGGRDADMEAELAEDPAAPAAEPTRASAPTIARAPTTATEDVAEVTTIGGSRSGSNQKQAKQLEEASLEARARPTGVPAAEAQAVQLLLRSGEAADARDEAQRLLDGDGLSDLRRADLYYFLGKAHEALGNRTRANAAYREAIRLRQ